MLREPMGRCEITVKRTRLYLVTPVEFVSLLFRTHPCILAFITNIFYIIGIKDDFCRVNFIHFALHIFQIRNLLHCVNDTWWNMPFKEIRLGDLTDDAVGILLPVSLHVTSIMTSRSLNMYCDVTQCTNGLWIFIAKLESLKGNSQT